MTGLIVLYIVHMLTFKLLASWVFLEQQVTYMFPLP